ncbi:MAG: hypothetical protein QXW75_00575 [Thermoplasmatales archaeon]
MEKMNKIVLKVGKVGRAMIPYSVRTKAGIKEGDWIVVNLLEVIRPEESVEGKTVTA